MSNRKRVRLQACTIDSVAGQSSRERVVISALDTREIVILGSGFGDETTGGCPSYTDIPSNAVREVGIWSKEPRPRRLVASFSSFGTDFRVLANVNALWKKHQQEYAEQKSTEWANARIVLPRGFFERLNGDFDLNIMAESRSPGIKNIDWSRAESILVSGPVSLRVSGVMNGPMPFISKIGNQSCPSDQFTYTKIECGPVTIEGEGFGKHESKLIVSRRLSLLREGVVSPVVLSTSASPSWSDRTIETFLRKDLWDSGPRVGELRFEETDSRDDSAGEFRPIGPPVFVQLIVEDRSVSR